ncbi:BTB/POZ domain-containing protein [Pyrus ussuriensis x Pyrus communis]|uniref:BTB/POZ domain-containing protein n=1 Tax=Pyrus ussuriensis x Pyrus communis TaxID=2448454 RepID=A0A5N5GTQ1_9ROSA|nr:BTB/POZ domain-containing protein [Pyrus ussuriensis x Pyrus communis]
MRRQRFNCKSCEGGFDGYGGGMYCKGCYMEADMIKVQLMGENEELKDKIEFLKLCSPSPTTSTTSVAAYFSDVVLIALDSDNSPSEPPVQAHKAVLVNRSPVFRAMFENEEMEESRSGTVNIADVRYVALQAFVSYLYTAETCLNQNLACDLLILAEKYQVQHLKHYCQKFLVSKLNWDNALTTYTFAWGHNAEDVMDAALEVITDNMDKLTARLEYDDLVKKDPQLVIKIYETYLSKQVNTDREGDGERDSSSCKGSGSLNVIALGGRSDDGSSSG